MEQDDKAESLSRAEQAIRRLDKRAQAGERAREEEARITAIVERTVDRRFAGWIAILGAAALVYWKGWIGFGISVAAFFAWLAYEIWVDDRTPGKNTDTAEIDAQDYVRHSILADLHMRGELTWKIDNDEEGTAAVAPGNEEFATLFWTQLERVLLEFEQATPRTRRRRLAEALVRSLPARKQMMTFAEAQNAKPLWWAKVE